jgi:hypothetical protein
MTPQVTVVVVAYRARTRLTRCLDALADQDLPADQCRVVVVDNASDDGTAELVADAYPWVDLIRSPVHRGFAGGNNLALGTVRTPYVVLLNDDAVAAPTFLSALLRDFEQSPAQVGALTARILLADRFVAASPGAPEAVHGPDGWWRADPAGAVRLVNSTGTEVRVDGFGVDRGRQLVQMRQQFRVQLPRDVLAKQARQPPARDGHGQGYPRHGAGQQAPAQRPGALPARPGAFCLSGVHGEPASRYPRPRAVSIMPGGSFLRSRPMNTSMVLESRSKSWA